VQVGDAVEQSVGGLPRDVRPDEVPVLRSGGQSTRRLITAGPQTAVASRASVAVVDRPGRDGRTTTRPPHARTSGVSGIVSGS